MKSKRNKSTAPANVTVRPATLPTALVAAIAAFAVGFGFRCPAFSPEISTQLAPALGLRPPAGVSGGLWRWLVQFLPLDCAVYTLAGAVCMAIFAYCIVRLIADVFALMTPHYDDRSPAWNRVALPLAALFFGLCVVWSEPSRRVFTMFGPDALIAVLTIFAASQFTGWLLSGGELRLPLAIAAVSLVLSDTPFALPVIVGAFLLYRHTLAKVEDSKLRLYRHFPRPLEIPFWRNLFIAGLALAFGLWANYQNLIAGNAFAAWKWNAQEIWIHWPVNWFAQINADLDLTGLMLAIGFCVLPMAVAFNMLPGLMKNDTCLSRLKVLILIVIALAGYSQCGPYPSLWFWVWETTRESVSSPALMLGAVTAAGFALALALGILVHDAWFCNDAGDKRPKAWRIALVAFALVVLGNYACYFPRTPYFSAVAFFDRALSAILAEAADARYIISDGTLDAALELAAHQQHRRLTALPFMRRDTELMRYLRSRDLDTPEERQDARRGVAALLRNWAVQNPERLQQTVFATGMDFWQRFELPKPVYGTFLAGISTNSAVVADAEYFGKAAAENGKVIHRRGMPLAMVRVCDTISWWISRMAKQRQDIAMAKKIDSTNTELRKFLNDSAYERLQLSVQATSREELETAMRDGNLTLAANAAHRVLQNDAEDPQAHFALAQNFMESGDWRNAEIHYRHILRRRPKDPSTLQALAKICLSSDRAEEALEFAEKALIFDPKNPEIQKTIADALARDRAQAHRD